MRTVLRRSFTATASPLPPDGVRSVRRPKLYRSADAAPTYSYDTGAPIPASSSSPSPSPSDKQTADAIGQIGKTVAETIGSLFGQKPTAPTTRAEKQARDVTLWVVGGVAVLAVVLVLRNK